MQDKALLKETYRAAFHTDLAFNLQACYLAQRGRHKACVPTLSPASEAATAAIPHLHSRCRRQHRLIVKHTGLINGSNNISQVCH